MIKKIFILMILFLFLSISIVNACENNSTVQNQDVTAFKVNETVHTNNIKSEIKNNSVSKLVGNDVSSVYGKKIKFSVKVLTNNQKPAYNKLVIFKVNNKKYSVYSDSQGIASVNLKLNAGKFTIHYSSDEVSSDNTIIVKNSYKIIIYKWKSGANVCKNKKIKKNLPESQLVEKMVNAAKKGTPLIKFKGASGKKIFITAGVHGNEIPSQIAALELIKYFQNNPVRGTVYIMPFVNPKSTAKNVRNLNYNLNDKANVKGTISYNIVKLIVKKKCVAYGDFHSTKPGGNPGKNVAMGTYKPTSESAIMAKYISKTANVKYLIYKKANTIYPGALEDIVNLNHIPAVTCEVISLHGKIASGSVSTSLLMMKALLNFKGLV